MDYGKNTLATIFFSLILTTIFVKAETFETPTWNQLIDGNDFITYAKVLEEGTRSAKVELLKVYVY